MIQEKIGFIILSPEPNIGRLKGTIRSIRNNYDENADVLCVVEKSIKKEQIDEMKEVCVTHKGGQSVTSLINKGFKHTKSGWNLLVMEGARIPLNIQNRYSKWIKSEHDVLFPITVNYDAEGKPVKVFNNFSECTLNGVLIHKNLFQKVGNFTENPLQISRQFWSFDAFDKGAVFKAILGIKIC